MLNIYVIIAIFLLILFILEQKIENKQILFYLGGFVVFFLLAFRGNDVGGDTINYCGFFTGKGGMYGTIERSNFSEPLFSLVCKFLSYFSRSESWFIFSTSTITMIPWLYLVKRDCHGSKILPLCLYMSVWGILSITQTAIRQCLSVSLILCAYIIWTSSIKKYIKYLVVGSLFLLSIISHGSSLIAIPILIGIFFLKFTKKSALLIVIGSFIIVLLFNNVFAVMFDSFADMLEDIQMADKLVGYHDNAQYELSDEISFNRLAPATLLVSLLILLCNEDDFDSIYLKSMVCGIALYNIGASFPMIFRGVFALLFVGILFVPYDLWNKRKSLYFYILILLLIYFIRNLGVFIHVNGVDHMLPYFFIWE